MPPVNPRLATPITAVTLALLAAATGCTSTSHPAATAKPTSATPSPANTYMDGMNRNFYLQVLRLATSGPTARLFPHFAPQQSSDDKLVAAAHEACTDLQDHAPGDVLVMLKQDGWTAPEAFSIMDGATQAAFCWDQNPKVKAWAKTAHGAIFGTS